MMLFRLRATAAAFLTLLQPALPTIAWSRRPVAHAVHVVHPALWRVQKGTSTLYLFGTIHALPPHFEWEAPQIRAVVDRADKLVLEAVIDDPTKAAGTLFGMGMAPGPVVPLADRVAPKFRDALARLEKRTGVPPETFDKMKTWAAGMALFGGVAQKLGVASADGVEENLKAQFRAAGKPVEGLETIEQQFRFFDTLKENEQRQFLEGVLDEKDGDVVDFGKMLGAWARGDEKGIEKSFNKDMKDSPALETVLITRRDAHWADAIVERLNQPGIQLIAVGAGHLVGPNSVQAMLAKLGYKVERVE
jgi:uncharacterized protein YbaP (TraB family)